MSPGRSHKPLFEHLAKDRDEPTAPTDPSCTVPADPSPSTTAPPQARVSLSQAAVYGFIAAAFALTIAAWTIAYRAGFSAGEQSWAEQNAPVTLPPPGPLTQPPENDTPPPSPRNQLPPPNEATPAPGILAADGTLDTDPRVSGSNYLELATLTRDQADAALRFLASRGVPAIAVPVDSAPAPANNLARYKLISIKLAVPSERFRDSGPQRRAHEDELKRLGAEWQENGGASNFAKPLWTRVP